MGQEYQAPHRTILCIDDDQDVLDCEKAFLETFGYTVAIASSGREGLELASLHSFDVVIVDYSMPEMNGEEFAIAMRQLRPGAPIIMLSGMADVPRQALKAVDAFVAKDRLATELLPAIALSLKFCFQQEPDKGPLGSMIWHRGKKGFIGPDGDS